MKQITEPVLKHVCIFYFVPKPKISFRLPNHSFTFLLSKYNTNAKTQNSSFHFNLFSFINNYKFCNILNNIETTTLDYAVTTNAPKNFYCIYATMLMHTCISLLVSLTHIWTNVDNIDIYYTNVSKIHTKLKKKPKTAYL